MVELRATARLAGRRHAPIELSESGEQFWAAVRALPQRQAQAAALRYVYDMPLAEIAATLGTSEGTVKQHLSRGRHSLAATLGATTQEEEL
jgi:RNA polymerase sigma-70 factor (ECF subfamily)